MPSLAPGWPEVLSVPKVNSRCGASNSGSGDLWAHKGSRGPPEAAPAPLGVHRLRLSKFRKFHVYNNVKFAKPGLWMAHGPQVATSAPLWNRKISKFVHNVALDGPMGCQSPDLTRGALRQIVGLVAVEAIQDPGSRGHLPHLRRPEAIHRLGFAQIRKFNVSRNVKFAKLCKMQPPSCPRMPGRDPNELQKR